MFTISTIVYRFLFYTSLSFLIGFVSINKSYGTTIETINPGSFIINMGITPQTIGNGLKPYGLIYELTVKHNVPVKWVIEPSKIKDGADFTYNGYDFKGGPYIIPAEYIDSTIASIIASWQTDFGVQGVYTTSVISVPVFETLTSFATVIIDTLSANQQIIKNYYNNAGIDSNAYSTGSPLNVNSCHDMWVNPHGDPTWATHSYLYDFVTVQKSYIWSQCHAVSNLEGCEDPSAPFLRLNYLTTEGLKCWKTTGTGAAYCGPSITETHGKNPLTPFTYFYPADPIMQFMDTMSGACANGSEKWFRPQSAGGWRTNTKRLITTSNGTAPDEGVLMVYGYAFDDSSNGRVMYTGGHDMTLSGNASEQVAAQRAFFNFILLAGEGKALLFSSYVIPVTYTAGVSQQVSVTVSSGVPSYAYAWTSSIGGTFDDPTAATTNYTPPLVSVITTDIIRCMVIDSCGRKNFLSEVVTIYPAPLPVNLLDFTAEQENNSVVLDWVTASEVNNDYFTINRSADGTEFIDLGIVSGNGTTSNTNSYSFKDHNPLTGVSYYRLQQTDFDGKSEIFKSVPFKMNKSELMAPQIIPNPFHDLFEAIFHCSKDGSVLIQLYDVLSNVVFSEEIQVQEGTNIYHFSKNEKLHPGLYILQMNNGTITTRIKIKCSSDNN